jgi:NitT/TauT family transport system substrate-binding protein
MRRLLRRLWTPTAMAAVLVISGCSGSSDSAAGSGPLEKPTIKLATLKLVDSAPVDLAFDRGYFRAEGLEVERTDGAKGSVNIDNIIGGSIDIGLTSYPPAFTPQARGVAKLKIVANAVQTKENLVQLVVWEKGPIKKPKDLEGKKVAVSSRGGISELALRSQFKTMGIDADRVEFYSLEIASMPAWLERGTIAGAVVTEPHLTTTLKAGAIGLMDPFTGQLANLPWSGLLATEKFVKENPKTVAAFQRAFARGVADTADRETVEKITVKRLEIIPETAKLMTVPVYPTTADPVPLQRVADLMLATGEIEARLDVREMLMESPSHLPLPATTAASN